MTYNYSDPRRMRTRRKAADLLWNFLTVVILLITACLAGYILLIFINPQSNFNPLPPIEVTEEPMPTAFITYTATPTKKVIFQPTWTPTLTLQPSLTPTPQATNTPLIFPTSADGTQAETSVPGEMSVILQGPPAAMQSYGPHEGCNWMGIVGQVIDVKQQPVVGLLVQFGGTINGDLVDTQTTMTGIASFYGLSAFEFTIADRPIATSKSLWIQIVDNAGLPLSEKVYLDTFAECDQNLILVLFKQIK